MTPVHFPDEYGVKKTHQTKLETFAGKPKRKIYRARYVGGRGGKGAWVTTVWRRTRQEAEDDIEMFAQNPDQYGYDEDKVDIIEMDYNEYLKKHQRLPKF